MDPLSAAQQAEDDSSIDLTPMLDVVFIMLIFFIVTASFIKEAGIDVSRPQAETAVKQDKANIFIALSPSGEIWIDRKNVPTSQLKATIEKLKAENPQGAVIIQADRDSKSKQLMQVMDAARDAGITQIAVATEAQE
ncbi:ExbD/TolR family protein [Sinimarinibacterium flocculans]|jgi:biopolymer transport protein ExbD|uniref:Outer membrane transport energization protein ExbD n=1 Tax=Sinimarinibacterium flocculans TaxID=985250 RepID=A0A318E1B5_9GAMM|nr:biopolymer transporter ExbD [Sinimarinibacterium flocculans]PXV62880.1 outer membrane transport energization protein ExbD [Sinimarinibacterium flocculans]HCZ49286.1 biopolymer transporter ExbD [Gammaproteobacteria bacterium]MCH78724.1 biopolymer transporter ExbD [Gammaproteobacteria bacterium]